jgi:hypothetical protein
VRDVYCSEGPDRHACPSAHSDDAQEALSRVRSDRGSIFDKATCFELYQQPGAGWED